MFQQISLVVMAVFYFGAGIMHFVKPGTYMKIMPPYLPFPLILVYASGLAESLLGVLLIFSSTRQLAAWGIIALLIAVFPANWYMYQKGGAAFGLPDWALLARLPIQLVLIAWAYSYT